MYPSPKMVRIVNSTGAADAFFPLKYRPLIPPAAVVDAEPLGSFE